MNFVSVDVAVDEVTCNYAGMKVADRPEAASRWSRPI
jgi:hypothetical protein